MHKLVYLLVVLLIGFLFSCGMRKPESTVEITENTEGNSAQDSIDVEVVPYSDYATYYMVITDTSLIYSELQKEIYRLSQNVNKEINTMNRSYDASRNLIALPLDDPDEIYAGGYYPRRFPSEFLSIEYMSFYSSQTREKNMALVSGIYEKQSSADSALVAIQKHTENAFVWKTEMYIGCMH